MRSTVIWLLLCALLGACCSPQQPDPVAGAAPMLDYLGQVTLPPGSTFDGVAVGGLSGITYDAGRDCYYVISDDRSARGPARFYTVRIGLSERGMTGVTVTAAHALRNTDDRPFGRQDLDAVPPVVPPDPEGIAFDAGRQQLYWSSEGERRTETRIGPVLLDPWVRIAGLDGGYRGELKMPPGLTMSAQHTGPRRNTTLEGLTLAPSGRLLFSAMEGPGYDDGPPTDQRHGALTRITAFGVGAGPDGAKPVAQYAYPLEPAQAPAERNGLPDLVALSDTTFLVLERAFSARSTVRVFRAEIGAATDVLGVPGLAGVDVTPMTKTLVADLSTLIPAGEPLDNVEGITLGPVLPDGRQSVVMVSDDNFSRSEVTQFLLFAVAANQVSAG